MIRNYFKIAWRNLLKNKRYTIINVFGLAVGVCCFILIGLLVKSEFSYDRFHSKADRIYRVWQHENYGPKEDFVNTTTPVSMLKVLKANFSEIEDGSRVFRFNSLVKRRGNEFNEEVRAVDSGFFQIFDFNIIKGNKTNPFTNANAIVLSESSAEKYFGDEDPIGKSLTLEFNEEVKLFKVSAIAADVPEASSIQFEMLVSLKNEALFFSERARNSWLNVIVESYVSLHENQSASKLEGKFPTVIKQQLGDRYKEGTFFLHLQPLTDIHFDTSLPPGFEPVTNIKHVYIMAAIGFLVLLLACINFVTLEVGRSFSRATEVGVRKVLGAFRKQVTYQFWSEALLVTLIAVFAGIILSFIFLGPFCGLIGKQLSISFDISFWIINFSLIVFIALVAGFYPSIVLSKFNPIEVLRRKTGKGTSLGILGKTLLVFQFTVSIVMLIATLVIGRQINYLTNKDLGYEKDALVIVPTNMSGNEADVFASLYIAELKKQSKIQEASKSMFSFIENKWIELGFTDSKNIYQEFNYNMIDASFLKTHDIQIKEGRNFQEGHASDAQHGVLVNEAFVKAFQLENPVGNTYDKFNIKILGVMNDFNYESLNHAVAPLMLSINSEPILSLAENLTSRYSSQPRISVKLDTKNMTAGMTLLKDIWEKINPSQEFEYSFLDETLFAQYQSEKQSKSIVNIASLLAVFIACMGLFGLTTLIVAKRIAEIGIRKIMGANVINIVGIISKDFIKLVSISTLFAFPIAWWVMNKWLQGFAYSIDVNWSVFVIVGITVLAITLVTVSFQAIKAAITNPIKSLRTE